ncbi:hypothetical protein Tco_0760240 [Tanacetum coccineum]
MQGVSKTDFENYVKANDAVLRNMKNQGQCLQNQMTNLTEMLSKFITSNTLHLRIQNTEKNPETSIDKVQKPSSENTAQVPPPEDHDSIFIEIPKPKAKKTVSEPNSPEPNSYQPKLPYPEDGFEYEPFSGSTTNDSNVLSPSSSPVKTSEILEEFADELTLPKKVVHEENFQVYSNPLFEFDDNFTSSNENPLFNEIDEDVKNKNSNISNSDEPVLLNTPLFDKVESSDPEDDI